VNQACSIKKNISWAGDKLSMLSFQEHRTALDDDQFMVRMGVRAHAPAWVWQKLTASQKFRFAFFHEQ